MIRVFPFGLLLLLLSETAAQTNTTPSSQIDSLYALYGQNKSLPKGFEAQALIALSHYPQLKTARICFKVKPAKLPYASKPAFLSLLCFWGPKKYNIIISNRSTALLAPTLLKNLSFEAQVGALGHELAHTAYYQETGRFKMTMVGIRYGSNAFKEKFEKMTDRIALAHGLGAYLLEWNRAVYPIKQQDGKRAKIYYSPEELSKLIDNQQTNKLTNQQINKLYPSWKSSNTKQYRKN